MGTLVTMGLSSTRDWLAATSDMNISATLVPGADSRCYVTHARKESVGPDPMGTITETGHPSHTEASVELPRGS